MKYLHFFMLKLGKKIKIYLISSLFVILTTFFFVDLNSASALSPAFNQVKTANSATVYYLDHNTSQRKAYINEAVFLDYGNAFSDVKVISEEVLAKWPEAKLIKGENSDDLYYINSGKKIKMNSVADIVKYNLDKLIPITVSDFELAQYESEDNYFEAGLQNEGALIVSQSDLELGVNALSLVAGTRNNALMNISLQANEDTVEISSMTFKVKGLYNRELVEGARAVVLDNNKEVSTASSFRDGELTLRFNNSSLVIPAGRTVILQIQLDFKAMSGVNNQNISLSFDSIDSMVSTSVVSANLPILAPEFKFVEAGDIFARVQIRENSLQGAGSNKNLAKFTISESSGQEDVYVRKLIFRNYASAGRRDLAAFRLRYNNQIISSAPKMEGNKIIFDIHYLRIPAGSSVELIISSNYALDYESGRTVNLNLVEANIESGNYHMFLQADISNLEEITTLP